MSLKIRTLHTETRGILQNAPGGIFTTTDRGQVKKTFTKMGTKTNICKAVLFVGLNDKETKVQTIQTSEAVKLIQREICKCFDGGTISEATGVYRHLDGSDSVVIEDSLRIEILFFDDSKEEARKKLKPFADTLKWLLNQETIALQLQEIESELI